MPKWGKEDSLIVICRRPLRKLCLGLSVRLENGLRFTWPIENGHTKTELSHFISIKESDIIKTENTIEYLYKKHGPKVFKKAKIDIKI